MHTDKARFVYTTIQLESQVVIKAFPLKPAPHDVGDSPEKEPNHHGRPMPHPAAPDHGIFTLERIVGVMVSHHYTRQKPCDDIACSGLRRRKVVKSNVYR